MVDPHLQIQRKNEGAATRTTRKGGPSHLDPEIGEGGQSQKHIFSALRALDPPLLNIA